ncbi:MAG: hypothetical protein PF518_11575 [Spirochaetaceae bacterium]|jgi:hypothetical protein|nr:hypothetical protein [Spirochaetaceae bacterium]
MRKPTVIIPYSGPDSSGSIEDVFLYLRPESNGIEVESILMNVLRGNPLYRDKAQLVYLANLPGDFIIKNHVVEDHYSVNYCFACKGRSLFTNHMKTDFENFYLTEFEDVQIVGAFDALKILDIDAEELFNIWVSSKDMMEINGQSIKKYKNLYIINYDIPALLHKNNYLTDIAVMILRSSLKKENFKEMIETMEAALIEKSIMNKEKPASRYFHYSKGPFEQILDGLGYLYSMEGEHLSIENISFARKLLNSGFSLKQVYGIINNPIMSFEVYDKLIEDNVFVRTRSNSFDEALEVLNSARCQIYLK